MDPAREIHLGLWLLTSGHHVASWRHPRSTPSDLTTVDHYVRIARIAERGKLDMVFFEDTLAARERNGGVFGEAPFNSLDPLIQIAAIAAATEQIGLAASYSTTYHSAATLAAKFAAIDALSGGRAGWNMVTSDASAARNFGSGDHPEHASRYANAVEVVHAVRAAWTANRASPQVQPVLIQAGMSSWGLDFASTFGEAVFAAFGQIEAGRAFRADLRERAAAKGRSPDSIKVLPGFMPIIGSTEREAQDKAELYRELIHPRMVRAMLGERFNIDFTDRPLDGPFPIDEIKASIDARPNVGGPRARHLADIREGETMAAYAERMRAKPSGHLTKVGTPEQIADFMQGWREGGGCDGFIIQALQLPVEFELFVDQVIPVLQGRGLYRRDYAGGTLRSHLGLDAPVQAAA
jgi:alkanesulfonate monooxygenase SsuD/methylene tetrahydromethanopterin reductase-like flavin-dependent oxidoreductase (luciferase family)